MQINPLDAAAALSDHELLQHVKRLAANERHATAQLVAHLAEVDARRLYLGEGCSSLFTYCSQVLHLSEHAAYGRIEAARAARKFPALLDALASGALHLTAVTLIASHLTPENVQRVIAAATHKTKRDVEELVVALRPQAPVPSSVRKIPQRSQRASAHRAGPLQAEFAVQERETAESLAGDTPGDAPDSAGSRLPVRPIAHATVKPLAPEYCLVKFTASRATHEKLHEAQALLRHQVPSGDVAEIFDRALTLLLAKLRKDRHAASCKPRATHRTSNTGRHVPAAVKREVWARDGGQCAFVGAVGRCTERGFLEYHHVIPFADGGKTDASNLQLRCNAHNSFEAERWSGPREEELVREVSAYYGGWCRPSAMGVGAGDPTRRWELTRSRPSDGHSRPC
jgi:5-methylcytosine-specific restriction endonuclease McrA